MSQDSPVRFVHGCSTDLADKPGSATLLPSLQDNFFEWATVVEQRSTESLRPVHSQILQLGKLRMHMLAQKIRISLTGFRPQWLTQARTDAWRLSLPKRAVPELRRLRALTYQDFGVPCADQAVRITERTDAGLKECSDMRQECPEPQLVRHVRHESPDKLLGKNFGIFGVGGSGKSRMMRELAAQLKAQGTQIYIIAYQNSVACKNGEDGQTVHYCCRK